MPTLVPAIAIQNRIDAMQNSGPLHNLRRDSSQLFPQLKTKI
jgi:hypothetical protein